MDTDDDRRREAPAQLFTGMGKAEDGLSTEGRIVQSGLQHNTSIHQECVSPSVF